MRYTIIASVDAGSMEEAWRKVGSLPLSLNPSDLEVAVRDGVRSMQIFSRGTGLIEWRSEEEENNE